MINQVETEIISGAMYELGRTIQTNDGIANSACNQAALRRENNEYNYK